MTDDATRRRAEDRPLSEIADYLDGKTTLGWGTPEGKKYRAIYARQIREMADAS